MSIYKYKFTFLFVLFLFLVNMFCFFYYSSYAYYDVNVSGNVIKHWVEPYINNLINYHIIDKNDINIYDYDIAITRGNFINLLMKVLKNVKNDEIINSNIVYFIDLDANDNNYSHINLAYINKIINGYPDGTFRSENNIERQDIFTIIGRAYDNNLINNITQENTNLYKPNFFDADTIADYAIKYVNLLFSISLIIGYEDNTIRPNNNISYAEVFVLLERILMINHLNKKDKENDILENINFSNEFSVNVKTNENIIIDEQPVNSEYVLNNGYVYNDNMKNNNKNRNNNYNSEQEQNYNEAKYEIENVISLKNVKSIELVNSYNNINSIYINSNEIIIFIIDTLSNIKLSSYRPLYNYYTGGGNTVKMTFRYLNGTACTINFSKLGIYSNDLFYPFININDGIHIEDTIYNKLMQIDIDKANSIYPDINETNLNFNISNSQQIWRLISFQKPLYSVENAIINKLSFDSINTSATTNNNILFMNNYYLVYQIDNINILEFKENEPFSRAIENGKYYWLSSINYSNDIIYKYVKFMNNSTENWYYLTIDNNHNNYLSSLFLKLNNLFVNSTNESISYNISASPLGIYFDNLAQNIEDIRLIEFIENELSIIYIKTDIDEYGYILISDNNDFDLKENQIYQLYEIINKLLNN